MYYGSVSQSRRLLLLLAVVFLCVLPLFFKDVLVEKYQEGGWRSYLPDDIQGAVLPDLLAPALEPVVFAFMVWSRGSAEEGAQLIKVCGKANGLDSRLMIVVHPTLQQQPHGNPHRLRRGRESLPGEPPEPCHFPST